VLRQATVSTVRAEPLEGRVSFNAQLARLWLTYNRPEVGAPRSLIAKLPTGNVELHQNAVVFRPGVKECWFYQHGASRTLLDVPKCYYSTVDDATGESFLLLEDLAPARAGDWVDGISIEEAALALRTLARLHAAWWMTDPAAEPELARLIDNPQEAQNLVDQLYQQAWPLFLERATFEISDDVRQFGERLIGRVPAAEGLLDQSPQTLIHGDFRLGNMLFGTRANGTRGGKPVCWVIDWEDVMLWSGMFDVAWFLGGCLRLEDSAEEEGLVRRYHRALTHAGVGDYSWAQCYDDYRLAMLSAFVQGVLTAVPPEGCDQYARDLAHVVGERFVKACQRQRLYELLP
jgi:hypothetical protein